MPCDGVNSAGRRRKRRQTDGNQVDVIRRMTVEDDAEGQCIGQRELGSMIVKFVVTL